MLTEPNEYGALFQQIKADLQNSEEKKVLIFVSTSECDSVCAVRVLQVGMQHSTALPKQIRYHTGVEPLIVICCPTVDLCLVRVPD